VRAALSDPAQVQPLFDAARETYGRVDILVNNAGVSVTWPVEEASPARSQELFNLNVRGPVSNKSGLLRTENRCCATRFTLLAFPERHASQDKLVRGSWPRGPSTEAVIVKETQPHGALHPSAFSVRLRGRQANVEAERLWSTLFAQFLPDFVKRKRGVGLVVDGQCPATDAEAAIGAAQPHEEIKIHYLRLEWSNIFHRGLGWSDQKEPARKWT